MENKVEIFKNEQFGEIRTVIINEEPWFVVSDVCKALGITDASKAMERLEEDEGTRIKIAHPQNPEKEIEVNAANESGLYSLVLGSRKPEAKEFKRWVTHDVIPTIRKTGGYVANDDLFISTYLGDDISDDIKQLFKNNLTVLRQKNEIIAQQRLELAEKDKIIEHKEDVIVGLVDDIDLATKRQRINQIVRYHTRESETISKRWNLLYSEFEKKYHVNLSVRFERYKDAFKPKLKNKVDVIDRQMEMIPQLYEVCCKLFENDVKILMQEWENAIVA